MEKENCVFCEMFTEESNDIIDITPLNPVVEGHKLIIPREHVRDFAENPEVTARVAKYAAHMAHDGHYNLITSKGKSATQSVFHLHFHLVPRWFDDGLMLPWTNQLPHTPEVE